MLLTGDLAERAFWVKCGKSASAVCGVSQFDFGAEPQLFTIPNKINDLVVIASPKSKSGKHRGNNLHSATEYERSRRFPPPWSWALPQGRHQ